MKRMEAPQGCTHYSKGPKKRKAGARRAQEGRAALPARPFSFALDNRPQGMYP